MCGIAGFCLHPDEHDIDTPKLARELLLNIEHRGRDATGAAWYEGDTLMVQKDGMKATHFVKWMDLPMGATNAILHTRAGTKGSEKDNNNNHPVVSGSVVGVHNGMVWNDDSLFRKMGLTEQRVGEVDTEAIFAAIAYGGLLGADGKPRLGADIRDILEEIEGSAAIAWLQIEGDPTIMRMARINQSPLVIATTKGGSLIFASEEGAIRKAVSKVNGIVVDQVAHSKEGALYTVRNGEIIDAKTFTPSYRFSYGEDWGYFGGWKKDDKATVTSGGKDTVVRAVHALSPPAKKDDKKENDDDEFARDHHYLSHYSLHLHVLSTLVQHDMLDEMDDAGFEREYRIRKDAIKQYITKFGVEDACTVGAEMRPGMWVVTDLSNAYDQVDAQIWLMPQKFPGGTYLLRAMIPNSRYAHKYEAIFVERMWGEFEVASFMLDEIIGELPSDNDDEIDDEIDPDDPRIREDDTNIIDGEPLAPAADECYFHDDEHTDGGERVEAIYPTTECG